MASPPVILAGHAMATRFELILHGENPVALRAAGEQALAEISRLEDQLSLYRNTSEIAHLNACAADGPVRVTPALLRLLLQARELSEAMDGAFDVTIGPLVRCWGFQGGSGKMPEPEVVAEARSRVGMRFVELDAHAGTVRFLRRGVMIDLGAIGKGFAIECAVEGLREAGVTSAILHGGTSTVYALGCPPDADHWRVAIERPLVGAAVPSGLRRASDAGETNASGQPDWLTVVPLRDQALSVSAVWGRSFVSSGRSYGHVIDPRTGQPVEHALLSAVVLSSPTETDALSTALLTLGPEGLA